MKISSGGKDRNVNEGSGKEKSQEIYRITFRRKDRNAIALADQIKRALQVPQDRIYLSE